jgi:hypothetical protein
MELSFDAKVLEERNLWAEKFASSDEGTEALLSSDTD